MSAKHGWPPTSTNLFCAIQGTPARTGIHYDCGDICALLRRTLPEQIPAWTTSRLSQLNQTPKRYVVEPALLGPLWQLDARAILRDGDLLGRIIDSFVAAQIRAECTSCDSSPTISDGQTAATISHRPVHISDGRQNLGTSDLISVGLALRIDCKPSV